jgi:hypothetical protein
MMTSSQCLYRALPFYGCLECGMNRKAEASAAAEVEVEVAVAVAAAAAAVPHQLNHQRLIQQSAQGTLRQPRTRCIQRTHVTSLSLRHLGEQKIAVAHTVLDRFSHVRRP